MTPACALPQVEGSGGGAAGQPGFAFGRVKSLYL
jgi:hypothetical protein